MKSDSSRFTFDPRKHFSSVRMQQGRVQIDADGNEQSDIFTHRVETEAGDVIGLCGGPIHDPAFHIVAALTGLSAEELGLPGNKAVPAGFKAPDFLISAGRYYVDGILCENESLTSYLNQIDLPRTNPDVQPVVGAAGLYLVYVDVWRRLLTALDDPSIREIALGGPDTATRVKTVWQVKLWAAVDAGGKKIDGNCATNFEVFEKLIAPSDGTLSARTAPPAANTDPCIVPPGAGYTGLENQLYRIEIHNGGAAMDAATKGSPATRVAKKDARENDRIKIGGTWKVGQAVELFAPKDPMHGTLGFVTEIKGTGKNQTLTLDTDGSKLTFDEFNVREAKATFKWSRDNGVVVTTIEEINVANKRELTVHDLGPDDTLGFKVGNWVEISDDGLELNGLPGQLAQITKVDSAVKLVTLNVPATLTLNPGRHPKLRRWDGVGAVKFAAGDSFLDLENGVQVRFFAGSFKTADYWTVAARTATADTQSGNIEWPRDNANQPVAQSPFGIKHHYCRLAMAHWDGSKFDAIEDCRKVFPPLTELTSLLYVNGAGQESMPGLPQPQALQAGVFNGRWPVSGARVRFTPSHNGRLTADISGLPGAMPASTASAPVTVSTGADGLASCAWMLDAAVESQWVEARLLDAAGNPLPAIVKFDGNLSLAKQVFYDPEKCPDLKKDNVTTVQDAIDHLCKVQHGGCCDVTVGKGGDFERLDQALEKLVGSGKTDICICLLAGDHPLKGGLTIEGKGLRVKIVGCGRGSRLRFPLTPTVVPFRASRLVSLTLRDLEMSGGNYFLGFDSCEDINVTGCFLTQENQITPFIKIAHGRRIRFDGNVISATRAISKNPNPPAKVLEASPALAELFTIEDSAEFDRKSPEVASGLATQTAPKRKALAKSLSVNVTRAQTLSMREAQSYQSLLQLLNNDAADAALLQAEFVTVRGAALSAASGVALVLMDGEADTRIEDNNITGVVSLYGAPGTVKLTTDDLHKASLLIKKVRVFSAAVATLHFRNNQVSRMDVSEKTVAFLKGLTSSTTETLGPVFRGSFITNNVFSDGLSVFVMDHSALTANNFDDARVDAGSVIARAAIYTANYAATEIRLFSAVDKSQKAANLMISIVDI